MVKWRKVTEIALPCFYLILEDFFLESLASYPTSHDTQAQRYVVDLGEGHIAWVSYSHRGDGVIALDYSEVPDALRGKGYGAIMMESALAAIAADKKQVVPVCGYTRHYINRHEKWRHLLHSSAQ